MEDGSETDPGPAGGEPTVGEGTSVAAANIETDGGATGTDPEADGNSQDPADAATDEAAETGAAAPEGTTLPVGQRAIFYEERTTDLQGSAEAGAVVWSLVQESPGWQSTARGGDPGGSDHPRQEYAVPHDDPAQR